MGIAAASAIKLARLVAISTAALCMQGCTTINIGPQDGQAERVMRDHIFVGAVRLRLPASQGNVQAADVKTLGVGWQSGPFVGWNASNLTIADPADCQLIIVIRSPVEVENAAKILASMKGQNPCVIDYTVK